jgi:hypothetical protein
MRDLGLYISELLHGHDCVIVPGFGGILANYRPASIHPTQHLFHPPSKRLVFNRSLTGNDGLLANHIASIEQVKYKTALDFIEKEVNKMVQQLQSGEKVQWKNIGVLQLDVEKNIQFHPADTVNYLSDSFGLHEFQVPLILREGVYQRPLQQTMRPAIPLAKPQRKKSGKRVLLIMAAIPVLAGLAYLPFAGKEVQLARLDLFQSAHEPALGQKFVPANHTFELQAVELVSAIEDSPASLDFSEGVLQPILLDFSVRETTAVEESAVVSVAQNALSGQYEVVAGCFSSEQNALNQVAKLKAKNFNARIIGKGNNGLIRVSAGIAGNYAEAGTMILNLEKVGESAWPLEVK